MVPINLIVTIIRRRSEEKNSHHDCCSSERASIKEEAESVRQVRRCWFFASGAGFWAHVDSCRRKFCKKRASQWEPPAANMGCREECRSGSLAHVGSCPFTALGSKILYSKQLFLWSVASEINLGCLTMYIFLLQTRVYQRILWTSSLFLWKTIIWLNP